MAERLFAPPCEQSLVPLVEKTDLLHIGPSGKIQTTDLLETPLDEYGIPRRVELMRMVLGTLSVHHIWAGEYDLHHAAWPGEQYRRIEDGNYGVGARYRGSGSLKVRLPRQLHNYVHKITIEPPMPPLDIMRQYALEHGQVNRLYDTIKLTSYVEYPKLNALSHEDKEALRRKTLQKKLELMQDGEIGIMPQRELLSSMELNEARGVLRSIARAKGISNSRRSQRSFFKEVA